MDICLFEKEKKEKNGEKIREICKKPTKYIIKIEEEEDYIHPRCGIHSRNIDDKNKIKIDELKNKNKGNDNNTIDLNNVTNKFSEKINISDDKKDKVNDIKKINEKIPCLQYFLYLRSKKDIDLCQFEDCQFAHNFYIGFT
jgi:hypothetical protein